MTKAEALAEFKEHYLPAVEKQFGKSDKPAKREAWHVYTDLLYKKARITNKQWFGWSNPF